MRLFRPSHSDEAGLKARQGHSCVVHENKDEIGGLAAELEDKDENIASIAAK